MCGVAVAVVVKGHLGFQRFQAPRQMSLHGGFILHSDVLTTWPPVLKMPTRQDPRSAGPPLQPIRPTALSQHTHARPAHQKKILGANYALD